MNGKLILGLLLILCITGCKSAQTSGKDPLLGKTRLDPPSTNARSVYVERQNMNESGLVPGGRVLADSPNAGSAESKEIQTASGETHTVHYPDDLDASESTPASTTNGHLKWRNAEPNAEVEKEQESSSGKNSSVSAPQKNSPVLTNEELANYRYVYDFSSFPPRKVPISGRNENPYKVSDSDETVVNEVTGNFPVYGTESEVSRPVSRFQSIQLVGQQYDPYAPNRQFERKRTQLSQSLASDFDSPVSPMFPSVSQTVSEIPHSDVRTVARETGKNVKSASSGWKIVSTPLEVSEETVISSSVDSKAGNITIPESASPTPAIGSKVQIPVSFPVQREKETLNQKEALELMELPE